MRSLQSHVLNECSPPSSDLPVISQDVFVGRENDIDTVISKLSTSHIVNINGAPGVGKSTLAIHIGYEMVANHTSVRYIDVHEKHSLLYYEVDPESSYYAPKESLEPKSYANRIFIRELQIWSVEIKCPTLLILDNCDSILKSSLRDNFIKLIYSMLNRSRFKLHMIVVSMEKLVLLNSFDRWIVRELNQSASVSLLQKFVPKINNYDLNDIAELVDGNPIALKVVGKVLQLHGKQLVRKIKEDLLRNPFNILDKVSFQKERFRTILDIAFARLGNDQDCGYILGLLGGSFDIELGIAIVSPGCLELYEVHSLLDEYNITYYNRYKMHRLIKEYVVKKLNATYKSIFDERFQKYYEQSLFNFATTKVDLSDVELHYLSLEVHNIYYLVNLYLKHKKLSVKQLVVLTFLVYKYYPFSVEELEKYFSLYLDELEHVCQLLSTRHACGFMYSTIVKYFYKNNCTCETVEEYMQNFYYSSCTNVFQCKVVDQISNIERRENSTIKELLSADEKSFIELLENTCWCHDWRVDSAKIFLLLLASVLLYIYLYIMLLNGYSRCWFEHFLHIPTMILFVSVL